MLNKVRYGINGDPFFVADIHLTIVSLEVSGKKEEGEKRGEKKR